MYLRPCRNCNKRTGCADYAGMLTKLRGTGVTSAKFKCATFLKLFKPGQRVKALLSERFEGGVCEDINGTITYVKEDSSAGKLVVYLDEDPFENSRNKYMRLWPKHLVSIDEPPVAVCSCCGLPEGVKASDGHFCIECGDADCSESYEPELSHEPNAADNAFNW